MHIQYKIGIVQNKSPDISYDAYRTEFDFKISKTSQSLKITGDTPSIGSGYVKTDQIISKYKYSNDFLIGEEPKTFINTIKKDFSLEVFPIINIANFLIKYRGLLKEVIDYKLDDTIIEKDSLDLLEIKADSSIHLKDKSSYTVDYNLNEVSMETPLEISSKLFSITFPVNYSYKKGSSEVLINLESILELTPGFYNVLPKRVRDIYKLTALQDAFEISNKKALKYSSDFNISYDKLISKDFLAPPSNSTLIKYTKTDLHPLTGTSVFDYTDQQEYIIYKLNGNVYEIAFKLPMHEQEQDLIDLLASHDEFKRPYSFIASKSTVTIKDYNDAVLERFLVINKDFKQIYNTPNNK